MIPVIAAKFEAEKKKSLSTEEKRFAAANREAEALAAAVQEALAEKQCKLKNETKREVASWETDYDDQWEEDYTYYDYDYDGPREVKSTRKRYGSKPASWKDVPKYTQPEIDLQLDTLAKEIIDFAIALHSSPEKTTPTFTPEQSLVLAAEAAVYIGQARVLKLFGTLESEGNVFTAIRAMFTHENQKTVALKEIDDGYQQTKNRLEKAHQSITEETHSVKTSLENISRRPQLQEETRKSITNLRNLVTKKLKNIAQSSQPQEKNKKYLPQQNDAKVIELQPIGQSAPACPAFNISETLELLIPLQKSISEQIKAQKTQLLKRFKGTKSELERQYDQQAALVFEDINITTFSSWQTWQYDWKNLSQKIIKPSQILLTADKVSWVLIGDKDDAVQGVLQLQILNKLFENLSPLIIKVFHPDYTMLFYKNKKIILEIACKAIPAKNLTDPILIICEQLNKLISLLSYLHFMAYFQLRMKELEKSIPNIKKDSKDAEEELSVLKTEMDDATSQLEKISAQYTQARQSLADTWNSKISEKRQQFRSNFLSGQEFGSSVKNKATPDSSPLSLRRPTLQPYR